VDLTYRHGRGYFHDRTKQQNHLCKILFSPDPSPILSPASKFLVLVPSILVLFSYTPFPRTLLPSADVGSSLPCFLKNL
jgi:hypothetical protein